MKKVLLFAAAASVAFTSCVKDEPAPKVGASDSKITFEAPLVGATTRANVYGEINGAYPTGEEFKVWGWYHLNDYTTFADATNDWKNYMTDGTGAPLTVTYDGTSTWAPAQDYFWPKNGKLTFAAYSPADAAGTITHTANGLQITNFTIAAVGEQYDLMYSDRSYNRTLAAQGDEYYDDQYPDGEAVDSYTGVDIVFHHALSSIVFVTGTKTDYQSADVFFKIKKITVSNVVNTGSFNEGLTDGNNSTTRTPAWTAGTTTASYVAYDNATGFDVPENGTTFTEPTGAADLILLPQTFTADNATVDIVYTMGTAASGEIEQTAQFKLMDATNASTWEPNKRYTYRIIFGLDKITFAPIVEPWDDVTVDTDIEL